MLGVWAVSNVWWLMPARFVYLVVVLTVDVLFGFNYGYVGDSTPGQPSVIDFLGPWPGRVGLVAILASLAMALLMLPWYVIRRRGEHVIPSGGA